MGKNLELRRKFAQKGALTLKGTFGKVQFVVMADVQPEADDGIPKEDKDDQSGVAAG